MGTSAVTPNVTMIAPDGSIGDVPSTNVNAAMAAGGKLGIHVYAPDGTPGYVPHDRLGDALKAGATYSPAAASAQNDAPHGLLQSLVAPIPLAAKTIYHNVVDAPRDSSEAAIAGTTTQSGIIAQALGHIGLGGYRTLIAPAISSGRAAIQDAQSPNLSNRLAAGSEALGAIPGIGQGIDAGKSAISQYLSGDRTGALGSVLGNVGAAGLTDTATRSLNPGETAVPGQNFTPAQASAMSGLAARATAMGKGFFPKDATAGALSDIRQAAADNPELTQAATGSVSPENSLGAVQQLIKRSSQNLELQHQAVLGAVRNAPFDPSAVQSAVSGSLPASLDGFAPSDRAALDELSNRLGTVKTLQGANDLRQYLNNETSPSYRQNAIAAGRSSTVDSALQAAADAHRNAFYDQLSNATGVDMSGLKQRQGSHMALQEALGNIAPSLAAKQAIAQEPASIRTQVANALQGAGTMTASPMSGIGKLLAQRVLRVEPMDQVQSLIRKSLQDLPQQTTSTALAPYQK